MVKVSDVIVGVLRPAWSGWTAGVAVTAGFALLAYGLRGTTAWGAMAGGISALALWISGGPGTFAALVAVFVIAIATTRAGYQRKQRLGVAENRRGRSAGQILANVGAAAIFSVLGVWFGVFRYAAVAALAEAAADTAASEIGEALSDRAYLITSFRPVPAGTDGGVTVMGTLAGVVAAAAVGAVATATKVIGWPAFGYIVAAAVLGTFADSLLGDLVERRGIIGNQAVNFSSTVVAGLLAMGMLRSS